MSRPASPRDDTTDPRSAASGETAIGDWRLLADEGRLVRGSDEVRLRPRTLDVLVELARRPGRMVAKDDLIAAVWGGDTVEDGALAHCISEIRKALGDSAQNPRYIETLPRRGYRLLVSADVDELPAPEVAPSAPTPADRSPTGWLGRRGLLGRRSLLALATVAAIAVVLVQRESSDRRDGAGHAVADVPRLMVLPFDALDADSERVRLADGLTAELITELVRDHGRRLGVIAHTTTMAYRDTSLAVRDIARELDVDWVLEGGVHRDGPRARVTVRLVGADGLPRWANEFDWRLGGEDVDLLAGQGTVADAISLAVALHLGLATEADADPAARTHPAARAAFLRGLGQLQPPPRGDPRQALAAFRRVVDLDPAFAVGWQELAGALHKYSGDEDEFRRAVERALALDASLPDAHRMLGHAAFYLDWDLDSAHASWSHALELSPHFAEAHHSSAAYWAATGRHDAALAAIEDSLALDPRSPWVRADFGWYAYFARRWELAIARCRDTLQPLAEQQAERSTWADDCLLLAAVAAGDAASARDAARAIAERLTIVDASSPASIAARRALDGDRDDALDLFLRWRIEMLTLGARARGAEDAAQLAVAYLLRGDEAAALDWLERAVRARRGWILPFLPVHPAFDPLRDEPRFEALVHRVRGEAGVQLSRRQPQA
ncbi:MAG: winged helix-turn-helix domain-containing protein [Holophagales bacterium]|nr:winged helix-turn-helix domain-containing protein [Holophagales bacterium]